MNNQVTINKENILNAYKQASEEQKELLRNIFGKDIFQPKDIRDRIKTFDDAFNALGDKHELVKEYKNLIVCDCFSRDIIAYAKLRIIAEALNEGWKPTCKNSETRNYPLFYIYTKNEYDELSENHKKNFVEVGNSNIKLKDNGSDIYAIEIIATTYSSSSIGHNITLRTRELAEYCGKQFIDIWSDFLFA